MNTSSRMMSSGDQQMIHISSSLKSALPNNYVTKERGTITVKGKGEMTTHWLESKNGRIPPKKDAVMAAIAPPEAKK